MDRQAGRQAGRKAGRQGGSFRCSNLWVSEAKVTFGA